MNESGMRLLVLLYAGSAGLVGNIDRPTTPRLLTRYSRGVQRGLHQ